MERSQYGKLVFVDLETTGANTSIDRITEIGIVEVDDGKVTRWSTLINPGRPIPPFIQNLTGISDDMVRDAPQFSSVATELMARLNGGLFIAHNARFDHGFLHKALTEAGHVMRNDVLCTVKLSRALNPEEPKHNLDTLIIRHDLVPDARHRALADADLVWQLWKRFSEKIPSPVLDDAIQKQLKRPLLPRHLPPGALDDAPEVAGVYTFYGVNGDVLFVGKGSNLRQHISSHFNPDRRAGTKVELAEFVYRIDWQEIIGDAGMSLAEAKLLKKFKPPHNRAVRRQAELCSWAIPAIGVDRTAPELVFASKENFAHTKGRYGLFGTRRKAEARLRELAESQQLCLVLLGLESKANVLDACAAHAVDRCRGGCIGEESPALHRARLELALEDAKVMTWPYPAAVGLVESAADGRRDVHVVQNWCYLGTAHSEEEIWSILNDSPERPSFDPEAYKILIRFIKKGLVPVRELSARE